MPGILNSGFTSCKADALNTHLKRGIYKISLIRVKVPLSHSDTLHIEVSVLHLRVDRVFIIFWAHYTNEILFLNATCNIISWHPQIYFLQFVQNCISKIFKDSVMCVSGSIWGK